VAATIVNLAGRIKRFSRNTLVCRAGSLAAVKAYQDATSFHFEASGSLILSFFCRATGGKSGTNPMAV